MARLTDNPVACFACRREVPPERLELSPDLVDPVAGWCGVANAVLRLWLDSGAYEAWAARELENPGSSLNERAQELVVALGAVKPTYHWWFQALTPSDPGFEAPDSCPRCGGPLRTEPPWRICDACRIALP